MRSIFRGMGEVRYQAGDRIVKSIFQQFNDINSSEHIENRVVILDELFSTRIRQIDGDEGLESICEILLLNATILKMDELKSMSCNKISELIDEISNEYKAKHERDCHSFVTKYLFWSVYAFQDSMKNSDFFIYDGLVSRNIKYYRKTNEKEFYTRYYNKLKDKQREMIKQDAKYECNRELDLRLWNDQKQKESDNINLCT
jgi:hypothetical protein